MGDGYCLVADVEWNFREVAEAYVDGSFEVAEAYVEQIEHRRRPARV